MIQDVRSYVYGWLVGYSALLGPVAGVMIADYYLVRGRRLLIDDLYVRGGAYEYAGGFNPRAIVALVAGVGVGVALIGLVAPPLHWLYDYAWFVGFFGSGLVYLGLMRGSRKPVVLDAAA